MTKTKRILDENDVDKIKFYFVNSPIVNNAFTVCVLINSQRKSIEARGVAICSLMDTFSKSEGKNKAFGRAVKALARRENNWKINGSGRDDEWITRSFKAKTEDDDARFRATVAVELQRIDPNLPIKVQRNGSYRKYSFDVPVSYPVRLANSMFKYKSHYRPTPVGDDEKEFLKELTIFTEPIENDETISVIVRQDDQF